VLLLALQPQWDTVLRWQTDGRFKTVTGYVLLAAMAGMWLPVGLRERFREGWQLEVIKVAHQWLGALMLLALLLHANLARSGYLAVFTAGLLVACGSGTVLSWMQQRGWLPGRRGQRVCLVAPVLRVRLRGLRRPDARRSSDPFPKGPDARTVTHHPSGCAQPR
jgi:hypothetical protein